MDQDTLNQYITLRASLDRIRDQVDRADGEFHSLIPKIKNERLKQKLFDVHDAVTKMNAAASGAKMPDVPQS